MTMPRHLVLRLALSGLLIASALPVVAPSAIADERPGLRLVSYVESEQRPLVNAQFMPGMQGMPGMMVPVPVPEMQMGGGMAMIMTGDTLLEMMAGACAAGLFVGGASVAVATAPAVPLSVPVIAGSAAVGCGFAVAATAAGMGGMMAWRALYNRFK